MSRALVALDRVVLALLALAVLAVSGGLVLWGLGRWPGAPDSVDLGRLSRLPDAPAWPWALAAGGVVAVLLGLRQVVAHAYRPRVRRVALTPDPASARSAGSVGGRLTLDLPAAARAAAEVAGQDPGIERARGHVVVDRGRTVVELVARVDAGADLARVRAAVDRTHAALATVVPPGTAGLRVRLDVHRGRAQSPRVV